MHVLALNEDDAAAFFVSSIGLPVSGIREKIAGLKSSRVENHNSRLEEERGFSPFWPLKKWESEGFDPELIKSGAGPTDCKWINQLGWCYRATIESMQNTVGRGWRNTDAWDTGSGSNSSGTQDEKRIRSESPRTMKARIEAEKKLSERKKKEMDILQIKYVLPLASNISSLPAVLTSASRQLMNKFTEAQDEINKAKTQEEIQAIVLVLMLLTILYSL